MLYNMVYHSLGVGCSEEGVPEVYTNIANYYIWYIIVGEWGAARREYPASTITLPTIISGIF